MNGKIYINPDNCKGCGQCVASCPQKALTAEIDNVDDALAELNLRIKEGEYVLMESFDDIIKEMDFNFFGTGEYGMSLEEAQRVLSNDHFIFLDIRTDEEVSQVCFPFAKHIPLNELPDRLAGVLKPGPLYLTMK